ncbi:MAG: PDZ domain-containing protein [Proteobacteria bacterium]|nr:PDZ domain-containing protein [Pseudomonadota bacterium]
MTLLFGFFVMLYSDAERVKDIEKTFKDEKTPVAEQVKAEAASLEAQVIELQSRVGTLQFDLDAKERTLKEAQARVEKLENEQIQLKRAEIQVQGKSEKVSIGTNAIAEQARLLFRAPCRMCVHFNSNIDSGLGSVLQASPGSVVVGHVMKGGPADRAGLHAGDVIETIAGRNPYERLLFESFAIGQTVDLKIRRFGAPMTLSVKLDAMDPAAEALLQNVQVEVPSKVGGLEVSKIGLKERITHYIPSEIEGLLVTVSCRRCGGRAYHLDAGDVVVSVNGVVVSSPDELNQLWNGMAAVEVWKKNTRSFELIEMSPAQIGS